MNIFDLRKLALTGFILSFGVGAAQASDVSTEASLKDVPVEIHRDFKLSANVTLTTEYVTDGISQTDDSPTVQGGFDLTYQMFYLGVWASGLDYRDNSADVEIDVYGGIKHHIDRFLIDVGFVYYGYPNADDDAGEYDFIEAKLGVSTDITERVNVAATIFYTPEFFGESGDVWSYEGKVTIALGQYDRFSPVFSARVGHLDFQDNSALSYTFWNVGLGIGIDDRFVLDLRYWDTDIDNNPDADGRFVAKLTASF